MRFKLSILKIETVHSQKGLLRLSKMYIHYDYQYK